MRAAAERASVSGAAGGALRERTQAASVGDPTGSMGRLPKPRVAGSSPVVRFIFTGKSASPRALGTGRRGTKGGERHRCPGTGTPWAPLERAIEGLHKRG